MEGDGGRDAAAVGQVVAVGREGEKDREREGDRERETERGRQRESEREKERERTRDGVPKRMDRTWKETADATPPQSDR